MPVSKEVVTSDIDQLLNRMSLERISESSSTTSGSSLSDSSNSKSSSTTALPTNIRAIDNAILERSPKAVVSLDEPFFRSVYH